MLNGVSCSNPYISLVIPTFNERENIAQVLKRSHAALEETNRTFEIIVVDDNSPDGTWQVAHDLCDSTPGLRVIRRVNERGLARAVVHGWKEARGEILAVIDGDLQHPPETLEQLIAAHEREGADIAVASRNTKGGGVSRWNLIRRLVSWTATLGATWIMPGILATIRDPMSGYFSVRRSVVEGRTLKPEGYKILLEVLVRGNYHTVEEVPYVFLERAKGGSKLGPRQYWEFIKHLLRLSWDAGELSRFVMFCIVGTAGIAVNLGMFVMLETAGLDFRTAGITAIAVSIFTNFLLNEFWTFWDISRRTPGFSHRMNRMAKYVAFCSGGAMINFAALWLLTVYAGIPPILSQLVGIGMATVWNYGLNANLTWDTKRAERLR